MSTGLKAPAKPNTGLVWTGHYMEPLPTGDTHNTMRLGSATTRRMKSTTQTPYRKKLQCRPQWSRMMKSTCFPTSALGFYNVQWSSAPLPWSQHGMTSFFKALWKDNEHRSSSGQLQMPGHGHGPDNKHGCPHRKRHRVYSSLGVRHRCFGTRVGCKCTW